MLCPKCNKEIEEDSIFCSFCGVLIKGSKKPLFDFKEHKTSIFIVITLVLLTAFIILLNTEKAKPVDIDLEFSIYPGNYTKAVIFALYADSSTNLSNIRNLFSLAAKYNIPYTVFLAADNISDYLQDIKDLSEEYNLNIEIGSAGYKDTLYSQMDYYKQEELIKQSKKLFEDIKISGFLPVSFSYNYDTILAAENSNIRFIALPGNELKPYHPVSPLQLKMNILIFPLYQANDWLTRNNGTFTVLLKNDANPKALESMFKGIDTEEVWLPAMQEMNDYIRLTEKMEAELVTDFKRLRSELSFRNLINNTRIEFKTVLIPRNITIANVSRDWLPYGAGFFLLLNEDDKKVNIDWKKPIQ